MFLYLCSKVPILSGAAWSTFSRIYSNFCYVIFSSQKEELEIRIVSLKDDLEREHQRWRSAQDNYERQVRCTFGAKFFVFFCYYCLIYKSHHMILFCIVFLLLLFIIA